MRRAAKLCLAALQQLTFAGRISCRVPSAVLQDVEAAYDAETRRMVGGEE